MQVQLFGRCGPQVEEGTQTVAKNVAVALGALTAAAGLAHALGVPQSLGAHRWRAVPMLLVSAPALGWGLHRPGDKANIDTPETPTVLDPEVARQVREEMEEYLRVIEEAQAEAQRIHQENPRPQPKKQNFWLRASIEKACAKHHDSWSEAFFKEVRQDLADTCKEDGRSQQHWAKLSYADRKEARDACKMLAWFPTAVIGTRSGSEMTRYGMRVTGKAKPAGGVAEHLAWRFVGKQHLVDLVKGQALQYQQITRYDYTQAELVFLKITLSDAKLQNFKKQRKLQPPQAGESTEIVSVADERALVLANEGEVTQEKAKELTRTELQAIEEWLQREEWTADEHAVAVKHIEDNVPGRRRGAIDHLKEPKYEATVRFLLSLYLNVQKGSLEAMEKALRQNREEGCSAIKFEGDTIFAVEYQLYDKQVPAVTLSPQDKVSFEPDKVIVASSKKGSRVFHVPPDLMFHYIKAHADNLQLTTRVGILKDGRPGLVVVHQRFEPEKAATALLEGGVASEEGSLKFLPPPSDGSDGPRIELVD